MTITGLMNAKESDISSVLQAKIVPFITKREKAFRQSTSLSLSILVPVQRLNSAFFLDFITLFCTWADLSQHQVTKFPSITPTQVLTPHCWQAQTWTQTDASMNITAKLVLTILAYIHRAKVSMMRWPLTSLATDCWELHIIKSSPLLFHAKNR